MNNRIRVHAVADRPGGSDFADLSLEGSVIRTSDGERVNATMLVAAHVPWPDAHELKAGLESMLALAQHAQVDAAEGVSDMPDAIVAKLRERAAEPGWGWLNQAAALIDLDG